MASESYDGLDHLPQPFLPVFGKDYQTSAFKFLVIGQDTKGWGQTSRFIEQELDSPGSAIEEAFGHIENQSFRKWGKNTHSFFGFVMALLAEVHGMPQWTALKWGDNANVLKSFAWANSNAVELWGSLRKHTHGVSVETWRAAREAGDHLNRLEHMLKTLSPRVVLISCKTVDDSFFNGLEKSELSSEEEGIRHYRIEGYDVDIFHTYHPGWMRNVGGPWSFLNSIREMMEKRGLAPRFPEFVTTGETGDGVIDLLMRSAPRPDGNNQRKYELVAWVAKELNKHRAFMSVPRLAQLVNDLGYTTNYGTAYVGTRGSYRLVRGAYHRAMNAGNQESATQIAETFRKPNFTYAYQ
jgi:hypothetical protein